jgi:hypothetical protein
MISDEERREVAKRLREISYKPGWSLGDWWLRVHGAVVGSEHCLCPQEDVAVIADLIDPGVCHNVYDENEIGACVNGFECSACGCVVEDCEGYYVKGEWNRCPKCARMVADD